MKELVSFDVCLIISTVMNTGMTTSVGVVADLDAGLRASANSSMANRMGMSANANKDIIESLAVNVGVIDSANLGAGESAGLRARLNTGVMML